MTTHVDPLHQLGVSHKLTLEEEAIVRVEAQDAADALNHRRGAGIPLQRAGLLLAARGDASGVRRWRRTRALNSACPPAAQESPLHCAARAGDVSVLEELLDQGAEVDALDAKKRAPLELASAGGHLGAMRLLLREGGGERWELLRGALAAVGSEAAAKVLLEENSVALQGPFAEDALWHAAEYKRLNSVRILLSVGVDADACDHEGFTVMHRAAVHGHLELAKLLLTRGVLRNRVDVSKRTALHVAAEHGHSDIAKLLLQAGWTSLMHDDWGCTPLHYASQWGHTDCVSVLLEDAGPELVDAVDRMGRTALHYAAGADLQWMYVMLRDEDNVERRFLRRIPLLDDFAIRQETYAVICLLQSLASDFNI